VSDGNKRINIPIRVAAGCSCKKRKITAMQQFPFGDRARVVGCGMEEFDSILKSLVGKIFSPFFKICTQHKIMGTLDVMLITRILNRERKR
jgi:hypothetical protein